MKRIQSILDLVLLLVFNYLLYTSYSLLFKIETVTYLDIALSDIGLLKLHLIIIVSLINLTIVCKSLISYLTCKQLRSKITSIINKIKDKETAFELILLDLEEGVSELIVKDNEKVKELKSIIDGLQSLAVSNSMAYDKINKVTDTVSSGLLKLNTLELAMPNEVTDSEITERIQLLKSKLAIVTATIEDIGRISQIVASILNNKSTIKDIDSIIVDHIKNLKDRSIIDSFMTKAKTWNIDLKPIVTQIEAIENKLGVEK